MAWSVLPFQGTRRSGVWGRSSPVRGHHRGTRSYDGRLLPNGRRLQGLRAVGQKERGNSGFDRFVFQDPVQSKGSNSSGEFDGDTFQCPMEAVCQPLVCVIYWTALLSVWILSHVVQTYRHMHVLPLLWAINYCWLERLTSAYMSHNTRDLVSLNLH